MAGNNHQMLVEGVEYLGVTAVTFGGQRGMALTMRLDPINSMASSNLGLTGPQAIRLWRDLCMLMANDPQLKQLINTVPDGCQEFYDFLQSEGKNPKFRPANGAEPKSGRTRKRKPN